MNLAATEHVRIDQPHRNSSSLDSTAEHRPERPSLGTRPPEPQQSATSRPDASVLRFEPAHATPAANDASIRIHDALQPQTSDRSNWLSGVAQLMAYCGVGGLTVGTASVIWGYFGNIPSYLPLGWLVLTFGQMMLFLGLVTMVSVGIDESRNSLLDQLTSLSARLRRIEEQPSRPHGSPDTQQASSR